MTTSFELGFFDEFQKIAAKEDDDSSTVTYRPSTKRGMIADPLKHLGYSFAGDLAGTFIGRSAGRLGQAAGMSPEAANRLALAGGVLGGLGGLAYSLRRNKKRALRRLQSQGLDDKSARQLSESDAFKSEPSDLIPIFGKHMAMEKIRNKLRSMNKRVDD